MNNPLVSICCITYNHEKFISQALEGFLMQQTNFEYEIIIADDCSTDKTSEIIKKYIDDPRNNGRIKYFRHPQNLGMMQNFVFALQQCTGKYIALCEGDDYWTDTYKLQKQVEFLEENPEFNLCFHKVFYVDANGNEMPFNDYNAETKEITTFDDLAKGNYINTCSTLLRTNELIKSPPNFVKNSMPGDWVINLLAVGKKGMIKMMNERMAAYRIHSGGIWSMKERDTSVHKVIALTVVNLYHFFDKNHIIKLTAAKTYRKLALQSLIERKYWLYLKAWFKSNYFFPYKCKQWKIYLTGYFLPGLYKFYKRIKT